MSVVALALVTLLYPAPAGGQATRAPQGRPKAVWYGEDGQLLPFQSDEEVLEFLRTAKVVSQRGLPRGITGPSILVLEKDGFRIHAHFNHVNEERQDVQMRSGGFEPFFRDTYKFNPAAYQLARLLGLDSVRPAVERYVLGKRGSVSLWIEGAFLESERLERKLPPPDPIRWQQQIQIMRVFDNLIYNTDRTQENILIDKNWKVWMIDHTRAFRRWDKLMEPQTVLSCERRLWEKLQALDRKELIQRLDPYLRGFEMEAVLKRRDRLVAHIRQLIAQQGEDKVLFTLE